MSDLPQRHGPRPGGARLRRGRADRAVRQLGLPKSQPEGQGPERVVPKPPELGQRKLALDLRYYLDLGHNARVLALVGDNPVNSKSKHVRHNLGAARLAKLKQMGINLGD